MPESVLRVHPAIGIARVGNSREFYIAPETIAGLDTGDGGPVAGGLPIKPGTEDRPITSDEIRDSQGALKRQAARFRIFQYDTNTPETYPNGGGTEIKIGSTVDGRKVADIVWTVHLANKKANCYRLSESDGVNAYGNGHFPAIRNPDEGDSPSDSARLEKLVIDAGPRAVHGKGDAVVDFDKGTTASYWKDGAGIQTLADYPKSFPDDHFSKLYCPDQQSIDTLGQLRTDEHGRCLVLGGHGRACGWYKGDKPYPLDEDVNNNGWFDDTADGPVNAVLVFEDGTTRAVDAGGWAVTTDPAYAPQTLNVVSLWDDIFDSFVRKLELCPDIYKGGFNKDFRPSFQTYIHPIFRSVALQRWTTNLPEFAIHAHDRIGSITAGDKPSDTILSGLSVVRNPFEDQSAKGGLMPLALGDAGKSFLSPSKTQYFFLEQWDKNHFSDGPGPKLGAGEYLDKAVLANCLGGRFSPGIDITFICREPDLYHQDWQSSGQGPFRINAKALDYDAVRSGQPFLTAGYFPRGNPSAAVEPGDICKFMAVPWHTDYNSCATHTTSPCTDDQPSPATLYWSWPAQRPVAVHAAHDVTDNKLGAQRFSVRGKGTETEHSQKVGRYQQRENMLTHWQDIGVVIQGSAIDGGDYPADWYLEVQSRLGYGDGQPVKPYPTRSDKPGADQCPDNG